MGKPMSNGQHQGYTAALEIPPSAVLATLSLLLSRLNSDERAALARMLAQREG
jgi:hypothetical protein